MKSKMARIVSSALALVILLTLVAGCGTKEEATPPVVLRVGSTKPS